METVVEPQDPPRKPRFQDLPPARKALIVAVGALELALLLVALRDLRRRPRSQVRGPKSMWAGLVFVQPVGPPSYLLLGRRRSA